MTSVDEPHRAGEIKHFSESLFCMYFLRKSKVGESVLPLFWMRYTPCDNAKRQALRVAGLHEIAACRR
jgi:hypothetical protein